MQNHLKIRTAGASLSVYAAILICALACGGGGGESGGVTTPPPPPPAAPTGNVVGTVRHIVQNTAIAGAVVSIGSIRATTGADGTFTLNNVPDGLATIRCTSPGMADYVANIMVFPGTTTYDIRLSLQEVFDLLSGTFTLYVPAGVTAVRGIIVARGPDTRPFADPRRSFSLGANPPPNLESELMALGTDYRLLAARENLAVLGHVNVAVPGGFEVAIFAALEEAAVAASRPTLATAPLLIHGISSGTPDAARLTALNPSRVAGLVLRVPLDVSTQLGPESGTVPTYVITAELDDVVNNIVTRATYQNVRGTGGIWAFAEEPRTQHQSHSASQRQLILEWFMTILAQREAATPGGPLRAIAEPSGWLGDPLTLVVASWADFVGSRSAATWFPTQATAVRWQGFTRK